MMGSRRNFTGLLLHEIGHAHFEKLKKEKKLSAEAIEAFRKQLKTPFAIDYLGGENSRWEHVQFQGEPDEFAAEFYPIYVTQGNRFKKFIDSLSERERRPWEIVDAMFKSSFNGAEYR